MTLELNDKKDFVILSVLFVIALFLRLGFTLDEYNKYGTRNWKDAKAYVALGQSFAEGDFFPTEMGSPFMTVGPITPLAVAASVRLTTDPIVPVLILNCLLGALLVFIMFAIGKEIANRGCGYFLAAWSAFNINLIRFNYQVLKEPFIFFLLPLMILSLIYVFRDKKVALYTILSALLFSLLIHTDERYVVYAPVTLLFIVMSVKRSHKFRYALLWSGLLIVSMLPWSARNYQQFGELVILTPRTTAITSKLWGHQWGRVHFVSEANIERSIEFRQPQAKEAAAKYGVQPRRYGKLEKYWRAFIHYWKPMYYRLTYIQYGFRPVKWSLSHNLSSMIFYGIFLPFYLISLILAIRMRDLLMAFLGSLPILHGILHTVMIWPLERYRLAMDFLLVVLTFWLIKYLYDRRTRRGGSMSERQDL